MNNEAVMRICEQARELEKTDIEDIEREDGESVCNVCSWVESQCQCTLGDKMNHTFKELNKNIKALDCALAGHYKCDEQTCIY